MSAADLSPHADRALADWLSAQGCASREAVALAGDVSLRRYFRLPGGTGTAILALYPPEIAESAVRFASATDLLTAAGVRVPRILAWAPALGAMLLEDLGEHTLYDLELDWKTLQPHFERAVECIARVRSIDRATVAALNPRLDEALLCRELDQTRDVFLVPRGLLPAEHRAAWDDMARALTRHLAEQAAVPCHRDFMARNLVPLPAFEIAVLDHQDLRLGPPHYDLASLLNDSVFAPRAVETALLEAAGCRDDAQRVAYHRAAAQRGLKAVGTFARFAQRGSSRHLPLIAPTGARALEHLGRLPEAELLPAALRHRLAAAFC